MPTKRQHYRNRDLGVGRGLLGKEAVDKCFVLTQELYKSTLGESERTSNSPKGTCLETRVLTTQCLSRGAKVGLCFGQRSANWVSPVCEVFLAQIQLLYSRVQLRETLQWVVVCRTPNMTKAHGISKAPKLTSGSYAVVAAWGRANTQRRQWHRRKDTSQQGQPRQADF